MTAFKKKIIPIYGLQNLLKLGKICISYWQTFTDTFCTDQDTFLSQSCQGCDICEVNVKWTIQVCQYSHLCLYSASTKAMRYKNTSSRSNRHSWRLQRTSI